MASVRILLIFIAAVFSSLPSTYGSQLSEFIPFTDGNKVGLKNNAGQVLIPAQYEAIGWSNNTFSLVDNTVGYKSNGKWGLITVQNKKLSKPEFEDLLPGSPTLIIARRKIDRSVKTGAGIINASGKVLVPLIYDGIHVHSSHAVVFTKSGRDFKYGLVDFEGRVVIPQVYLNIFPLGSLRYAVVDKNEKIAIFSETGTQLTDFSLDSISQFRRSYALIYQNGLQGVISREGEIKLKPEYREININDDGSVMLRDVDEWIFLSGSNANIRSFKADSLEGISADLYQATRAGKAFLLDQKFSIVGSEDCAMIYPFRKGRAKFRGFNGKMGVIDERGVPVVPAAYQQLYLYDRWIIGTVGAGFEQRCVLLNEDGKEVSPRQYDDINAPVGNLFAVRNKKYWGVMDDAGKERIACVHDSILQIKGDLVVVKFKGKYGVMNSNETWLVTPQSHKVRLLNDTHYFLLEPVATFLKSYRGELIYFSNNSLEFQDDHLIETLPDGNIWKISLTGLIVDRYTYPKEADKIFEESEGLRAISKDERYGFIDARGRLRIANRYEAVKPFREGLAAAMIRGKWGFINKQDNIAIQPAYDDVTPFEHGYSIVKLKEKWGVIDLAGKIILPARYEKISVLPADRFLIEQDGFFGLADSRGNIVLHPKYDKIEDLNNGYFIVARNNKWGVITTEGVSTVPMVYDELRYDPYHQQFLALKKAEWKRVQL